MKVDKIKKETLLEISVFQIFYIYHNNFTPLNRFLTSNKRIYS